MTWMNNKLLYSSYPGKKTTCAPRCVSQIVAGFEASEKNKKTGTDVSAMRRALKRGTAASVNEPVSVVDSMKLYSMALQKARKTSNNTALEKKKLKYSFKKISSKIISSKTSTSAREAVSQAKREIQKLKKAARSGKYDPEEIEAALDHAKAMERIARKKVRHLEEEEMARRNSKEDGTCSTPPIDEEREEERKDPVADEIKDLRDELGGIEKKAEDGEYVESEEVTNEMIDEICDRMEEMLNAIEDLNDLMNELVSDMTDPDPEDIDAMVIKHRNKEMKEITKADAEYLKAVFEQYEAQKSGESVEAFTASGSMSIDVAL